jgi:hypothetical protein
MDIEWIFNNPDKDCGTFLGQYCAFNNYRQSVSDEPIVREQQIKIIQNTCGLCLCTQSIAQPVINFFKK